jgi:hypothetical protein
MDNKNDLFTRLKESVAVVSANNHHSDEQTAAIMRVMDTARAHGEAVAAAIDAGCAEDEVTETSSIAVEAALGSGGDLAALVDAAESDIHSGGAEA